MSLGLSTLEKPLELSSHPDRQPERGALGWNLPLQDGVYMGLATLEKPLELNQKIPVFCWNPQDFHFSINYSFSDSLRPSWPQSLFSVEFLLNGKLIEQL